MDRVTSSNGNTSNHSFIHTIQRFAKLSLSIMCFAYGSAMADTNESYWPPAAETITENNISVRHIGSAMRYQGSSPLFIASLYTQDDFPNTAVLYSNDGSKELQLIVMNNAMSHRRFQRILKNDLIVALSDEEYSTLQPEIQHLLTALKKDFRVGTLVRIKYDALRDSTMLSIDNERKTYINGKDIFNAMLKSMVGERPPSRLFKESLLGKTAPVIDISTEQEVLLSQYMEHLLEGTKSNGLDEQGLAINTQGQPEF